MKKKYYINILGMIAFIFLSGCHPELEIPEKEEVYMELFSKTKADSALDYYWYDGNKIPLTKLPNKKFVIFKANTESSFQNNLKTKGITLNSANIHIYKRPNIKDNNSGVKRNAVDDNYKWTTIEADDANKLSINNSDIIYEAPYYKTESGDELMLSNIFYVKLKSVNDINILQNLAIKHNVEILGETLYQPLWIVLSCTNNSSGNALDMSNLFYETGLFDKVDVNFTRKCQLFQNVNDPYFSQQWYLKSSDNYDIKYLEARSITQGSGSTIAIIDQGVQLNHPDITNVIGGYDPINHSTSQVVYGNHGTSVAGMFGAATNNNIGIASVAPSANILSISYPFDGGNDYYETNISNAFYWAVFNGADVINCSWGISPPSNMINDAISFAFTEGRLGKGCIVVFAVGNDGKNEIAYPANSYSDIVAVGASDTEGKRWDITYVGSGSGSNYGTQLDVVAPGTRIVTTMSEGGYTDRFFTNGTSFSAPLVSGLAALILSVNPELKQKEVVDIIEKSARKLPNYSFLTYSGRPNGTWNNEVGYGLIDAYAALLLAQNSTQNPEVVEFNDKVISSDQTVIGQTITSTVKNNLNHTITVLIPTANSGNRRVIYPKDSVEVINQSPNASHGIPTFNLLYDNDFWKKLDHQDQRIDILSHEEEPLKTWYYTKREEPDKQFFNKKYWKLYKRRIPGAKGPDGVKDEEYRWVFEITPEDIAPINEM